jgi:hypothetical protein
MQNYGAKSKIPRLAMAPVAMVFSTITPTAYKCRESQPERRVNLYKLVRLWRDQPYFLQNKANFKKAGMNVSYYFQKDCENEPRLCKS